MKPALIILAIITALALIALNVSAFITAVIAVATGPLFDRESAYVGWLILFLLVLAVGVMALASRRAYRQIERDFAEGVGAMDAETTTRYRAETEATRKPAGDLDGIRRDRE